MSALGFRSPVEIADAVVAYLEAATWLRPDGESETAFGRVKRFSTLDFAVGAEALLLADARIAAVVPISSRWETMERQHGLAPVCRRTVRIGVIVSDRKIGDLDAAAYGTDENPGCIELQEIALAAGSGPLFSDGDEPQVHSVPISDDLDQFERAGAAVPGRVMSSIEFDCSTSWMEIV